MSNSSSPADAPSEAIRHVCPEAGSAACRASNRSSLSDIKGIRIKHMATASVMAVAMDTLTVPRRTPKYAVARRASEVKIQTKLEKSSKIPFYSIGQLQPQILERNIALIFVLIPLLAAVIDPHYYPLFTSAYHAESDANVRAIRRHTESRYLQLALRATSNE